MRRMPGAIPPRDTKENLWSQRHRDTEKIKKVTVSEPMGDFLCDSVTLWPKVLRFTSACNRPGRMPNLLVRLCSFLAGLVGAAYASPSWAQATSAPAAASSTGSMLQMLLGLAVVLAVILAAAWFLRRIGMPHAASNHLLKPIGSLALGTRERVVVIEIADQWLVLGVTAQQISTLHTLSKRTPDADKSHGGARSGIDAAFAQKLKDLLRRSEK